MCYVYVLSTKLIHCTLNSFNELKSFNLNSINTYVPTCGVKLIIIKQSFKTYCIMLDYMKANILPVVRCSSFIMQRFKRLHYFVYLMHMCIIVCYYYY